MKKPVILTGLRANGELHLGNYLGGILPMVQLQKRYGDTYQLNMFVPDLHSFVTPIDHTELYQNTLNNVAVFVAAGLDLDHPGTYIYRQSFIPAHSELQWILSNMTYIGEMQRMTQFKDKSKSSETISLSLLTYPVLMAADILLYGATYVPVGEDQRQHLELTRDIAERINNKFGEIFTVPVAWNEQIAFSGLDDSVRIRSLRYPDKKMSKSVSDPAGTILLSDSPDEAVQKIMRAETDNFGSITYDTDKQPGISNLLQILSLLTNTSLHETVDQWSGNSRYGELKNTVAEHVSNFLINFQKQKAMIDQDAIIDHLQASEAAMNAIANETLLRMQRAVGLRS